MYLVLLGVIFLLLKFFDIAPFARWEWWQALIPFGLAAIWWWIADKTGYYARQQMQKDMARREARRQRAMDALRQPTKRR